MKKSDFKANGIHENNGFNFEFTNHLIRKVSYIVKLNSDRSCCTFLL